MVIEITNDVFNGENFKELNHLIQIATYKNRYDIFVDLPLVRDAALYERLDVDDKELLNAYFTYCIVQQDAKKNKRRSIVNAKYTVCVTPRSNNEFDLTEAIFFLSQPVSIILENSLHDAYFIRAIIMYFDENGVVKKHLENRWLTFENGGGCTNVANVIRGKLTIFDTFPKANNIYLRCFVLLDSDRDSPNVNRFSKHGTLLQFLTENVIPFHVLEKRTMENYMPDAVFEEFRGKGLDDWIDAYNFLSDQQKDFLNIPVGFSKKDGNGIPKFSRDQLHEEVRTLYGDLSSKNYDILNMGFSLADFKGEFPLKFMESHNVHKKSLIDKVSHHNNQELAEIVKKIEELL